MEGSTTVHQLIGEEHWKGEIVGKLPQVSEMTATSEVRFQYSRAHYAGKIPPPTLVKVATLAWEWHTCSPTLALEEEEDDDEEEQQQQQQQQQRQQQQQQQQQYEWQQQLRTASPPSGPEVDRAP